MDERTIIYNVLAGLTEPGSVTHITTTEGLALRGFVKAMFDTYFIFDPMSGEPARWKVFYYSEIKNIGREVLNRD